MPCFRQFTNMLTGRESRLEPDIMNDNNNISIQDFTDYRVFYHFGDPDKIGNEFLSFMTFSLRVAQNAGKKLEIRSANPDFNPGFKATLPLPALMST